MSENARLLAKPNRATAAEQITQTIFNAILDGTFQPGVPLRLQELARQLGTSMMPVREALRQLEGLGLVEIHTHRGAWVRAMTRTDLLDTYFTRINLEALALSEAAKRFTPADAERARHALEEQAAARASGDPIRFRTAHEQFHFTLYQACGSEWLMRSILPAWRNSERYRIESMRHAEDRDKRRSEHDKILGALMAGDAETAVACLVRHLQTSMDLVLESLPAAGEGEDDGPYDLAQRLLRVRIDDR